MEDLDIAKGLLSTILTAEIVSLTVKPQEMATEIQLKDTTIRIFRIDFVAVIQEKNGDTRKILIELQKSKRHTNVIRFRRYLAEKYSREDSVIINGLETKQSLEIVSIYLLGFNLDFVPVTVLHIKNCFTDVSTGLIIETAKREDFVRLLNHESYMIRLKKLLAITQTPLEKVLDVFNQTYKTVKDQRVDYKGSEELPLVQKIVTRLTRAIADEEMRRKMDLEEEMDRDYQEIDARYAAVRLDYEKQKQELEENKQEIEEMSKEMEEKNKEMEAQAQMIADLKRQLEQKK